MGTSGAKPQSVPIVLLLFVLCTTPSFYFSKSIFSVSTKDIYDFFEKRQ